MKMRIPSQLIVGLGILVVGGALVGGEFLLVRWWPGHKQRVSDATLTMLPYHNASLGIDMQVAAGIYGQADPFPGGVKISRPKFMSIGPSLTLSVAPNPDKSFEFTPQALAKWETDGVTQDIPGYNFEHTKIDDRDAVLIRQQKDRIMWFTARIISPDHILVADCSPGKQDEALYLKACEDSLRTIQVAGAKEPPPSPVTDLTRGKK